jgi:hypothetical protein
MQGYCVKCRAKKEMRNAKASTMKNGRPAIGAKSRIDEDERLAHTRDTQCFVGHPLRDVSVKGIVDFSPFAIKEEFHIGIEFDEVLDAE